VSGNSLVTTSSLTCPHGGSVQFISSNTKVMAGGIPITLVSDTATISGCSFQIPVGLGTIPSPCIYVQWIVPDTRVRVGGTFTLSQSSTGLCIGATGAPQGPVMVNSTQSKVSSQ